MIDTWQLVRPDGNLLCEWLVPEHSRDMWQPSHPAIEGDYGWAMKVRREKVSDDELPEIDDEDDDSDIKPEDFAGQSGFNEMGKMGLSVFRAVIRDGGSWNEAFAVTSAFFAGAMKAMATDSDDDDD